MLAVIVTTAISACADSGNGASGSASDQCLRKSGGSISRLQRCAALIDAPTDRLDRAQTSD